MASSLLYVMPVLAFLFVAVVSYALFSKTKILGDSEGMNVLVSFLIAVLFVVNPTTTKFTLATVPWLAVLLLILVFVFLILIFLRGKVDDLVESKVVAFMIVAIVLIIFLAASLNVFGPLLNLLASGSVEPASTGTGADLLLNPTVIGAIILIVISAITYYFLTGDK